MKSAIHSSLDRCPSKAKSCVRITPGAPFTPEHAVTAAEKPLIRWTSRSPAPRGLLSERSHPNAAGLDDGEATSSIVTRRYEVGEPLPGIARLWHGHAQQDDPAGAQQRRSSRAEILVKGQQNALLTGRPCQDVRIGCTQRRSTCLVEGDVVAAFHPLQGHSRHVVALGCQHSTSDVAKI